MARMKTKPSNQPNNGVQSPDCRLEDSGSHPEPDVTHTREDEEDRATTTVTTTGNGALVSAIVDDGDVFIQTLEENDGEKPMLLQVSGETLKQWSAYFAAQLGQIWDRNYTIDQPLVLDDKFGPLKELMRIIHGTQDLPLEEDIDLIELAVLYDKYMVARPVSQLFSDLLVLHLMRARHITKVKDLSLSKVDRVTLNDPPTIPAGLLLAHLFNLPQDFGLASRMMLWCMTDKQVKRLLPAETSMFLNVDVAAELQKERKRLREAMHDEILAVLGRENTPFRQGLCAKILAALSSRPGEPLLDTFSRQWQKVKTEIGGDGYGWYSLGLSWDDTKYFVFSKLYRKMGAVCLGCAKGGDFAYRGLGCARHDIWYTFAGAGALLTPSLELFYFQNRWRFVVPEAMRF